MTESTPSIPSISRIISDYGILSLRVLEMKYSESVCRILLYIDFSSALSHLLTNMFMANLGVSGLSILFSTVITL